MPKFSHAFTYPFEVTSNRADASDVTSDMLRAAIKQKVNNETDEEIESACLPPFDTFEE